MRVVIDSNQLQAAALSTFLERSKQNVAVLTDYAAMEAYKGSNLEGIYKSMEILAAFPDQVLVLKGTQTVCGLSGRGAGLQKRLIDDKQTKEFSEFSRGLRLAKTGNLSCQKQLLDHGREATAHLERMAEDAKLTGEVFARIAGLYSKEERTLLRSGLPYTSEMIDRIVKSIITIAAEAFSNHPMVRARPSFHELPNTFIFRASLCMYLLALDWAARGGAKDAKPLNLRNDIVDTNFAAYASYFDGLLSADAKASRIHQEARIFLSALFSCHMHG